MMRRSILAVFALVGLLGIGLTAWTNIGDSAVVATTDALAEVLQSHGQGANAALRDDLFAVVLQLQWPWAVARWLGVSVIMLAAVGFVAALRFRE